jgi:hypothetical protein
MAERQIVDKGSIAKLIAARPRGSRAFCCVDPSGLVVEFGSMPADVWDVWKPMQEHWTRVEISHELEAALFRARRSHSFVLREEHRDICIGESLDGLHVHAQKKEMTKGEIVDVDEPILAELKSLRGEVAGLHATIKGTLG